MNGLEKLWFCRNAAGRIFITSPQSPIPTGYVRYATTIPKEMDKVYAQLDLQTRREYADMTEADFNRRKNTINEWRSNIRSRMASSDCSNFERDLLKAALSACDKREEKLNRLTVYGISAMQTTEANPRAAGENQVHSVPKESDNREVIFTFPKPETIQ
jgi:hypothetical protein